MRKKATKQAKVIEVLGRYLRVVGLALLASNAASARSLYLNGIDISGSLEQTLKNVTVRIDKGGNVYITAPHYHVNEEEGYVPLGPKETGIRAIAPELKTASSTKPLKARLETKLKKMPPKLEAKKARKEALPPKP